MTEKRKTKTKIWIYLADMANSTIDYLYFQGTTSEIGSTVVEGLTNKSKLILGIVKTPKIFSLFNQHFQQQLWNKTCMFLQNFKDSFSLSDLL